MFQILFLTSLTTTFKEDFSNGMDAWVSSNWNDDKMGTWDVVDQGLKTMKDASFYAISSKMPRSFSTEKDFFVQYSVKNPQSIDCGGSYLKLFPSTLDQTTLKGGQGEDKYHIMFGPDFCGSVKKTHLIFNYADKNHENKKNIPAIYDTNTHLYTFGLYANGSYAIWTDVDVSERGELRQDYAFLPPMKIPDPSVKKPEDWVDEAMMQDPTDLKPSGWDDIPSEIPDPDATKPEDWDDEDDGVWEPPLISNPEYKGEWKPRMIENPQYKGAWVHPMIENPDYKDDPTIAIYPDVSVVAFELWQVKSGTIFDNIVVTDDFNEVLNGFDAFDKLRIYELEQQKVVKEDEKVEKKEDEENGEKEEL